jgi:hypothetical protein
MSNQQHLNKQELRAARLRNLGIDIDGKRSPDEHKNEEQDGSNRLSYEYDSFDQQEYDEMLSILFLRGGAAVFEDMNRWCSEGFRFYNDPSFGLQQLHGGPCGVLAVVQAEIIRELMFNLDGSSRYSELPQFATHQVEYALIAAFYIILQRIASNSGDIVLVTMQDPTIHGNIPDFSLWNAQAIVKTIVKSREEFFRFVEFHLSHFRSNAGCLLFLLSAMLTRYL